MSRFTIFADASGRKCPQMNCFWYETSWNPQRCSDASSRPEDQVWILLPGISWKDLKRDNQSIISSALVWNKCKPCCIVYYFVFSFFRRWWIKLLDRHVFSKALRCMCTVSSIKQHRGRTHHFWPCLYFISSKFEKLIQWIFKQLHRRMLFVDNGR